MREALLYEHLEGGAVKCVLCSRGCVIPEGGRGFCGVRENRKGKLYSLVYGKIVAAHIDPIEKKPLFHYYPGSTSFSIATVGCNFACKFCQNWEISQAPKEGFGIGGRNYEAEDIVKAAKLNGCRSISYTYTEPTVFFEFAYDCSKLAAEQGIGNVFVTNGYMSEEALGLIKPYLNAANVDLKAFSDDFYRKLSSASLEPVLRNLKLMKKYGIWVEVTTLLIPNLNDSEEELRGIASFIKDELGKETPWHVTRFHPHYKLTHLPPTPVETVKRARQVGLEEGLYYVYSGNIYADVEESTFCYNCEELLIRRQVFSVVENRTRDGKCPSCSAKIHGIGL